MKRGCWKNKKKWKKIKYRRFVKNDAMRTAEKIKTHIGSMLPTTVILASEFNS